MFQNILSPIRSRFDLSPRSSNVELPPNSPNNLLSPRSPFHAAGMGGSAQDDLDPEEFARDVLIELMRNAVEGLKEVQVPGQLAEGKRGRQEILGEIHRIMLQDACTKDIFREMDGFLGIMSILSMMDVSSPSVSSSSRDASTSSESVPFVVVEDMDPLKEPLDTLRLVFEILSEAMKGHEVNARWFRENVRYEMFAHALRALLLATSSSPISQLTRANDHILSLLLCLCLSDFSPNALELFAHARASQTPEDTEVLIKDLVGTIGKEKGKAPEHAVSPLPGRGQIVRPEALEILWTLGLEVTKAQDIHGQPNPPACFALFKLFESMFYVSHRNVAVLASLGRIGDAWQIYRALPSPVAGKAPPSDGGSDGTENRGVWLLKQRDVLQRLLKRILEIGTTTVEARRIFQEAVVVAPPTLQSDAPSDQPPNSSDPRRPRRRKTFDPLPAGPHFKLDPKVIEIIRHGIKSRWVEHFSFEGPRSALIVRDTGSRPKANPGLKGITGGGWTFMSWFRLSDFPQPETKPNNEAPADPTYALFSVDTPWRTMIRVGVRPDGALELYSRSPVSQPTSSFSLFSPTGDKFGSVSSKHRMSTSWSMPSPGLLSPPPTGTTGRMQARRSISISSFASPLLSPGQNIQSPNDCSPFSQQQSSQPEFEETRVSLEKTFLRKGRWTHLTIICLNPAQAKAYGILGCAIRVFIDGVLTETVAWSFPKLDSANEMSRVIIGDLVGNASMSWVLASAYMFGVALPDELPRLVHHLSPRYTGDFMDPELVKFLTYEASTSLNIYLHASATAFQSSTRSKNRSNAKKDIHMLVRALKQGTGLTHDMLVFSFAAAGAESSGFVTSSSAPSLATPIGGKPSSSSSSTIAPVRGIGYAALGGTLTQVGVGPGTLGAPYTGATSGSPDSPQNAMDLEAEGDVFAVKVESLDSAMWKIGGAAVGLRLVQLAETPHELSRTIGILVDGLKTNWQNSEDMERLRGFEILADILREKAYLINMTGFETIFEFIGVSFGVPELSTVYNAAAYRALALDFSVWAKTDPLIQQAYFDHFSTLLLHSRYKSFNARQRLSKMNLVRRVLFALQIGWYSRPHPPNSGFLLDDSSNPDTPVPAWRGLIDVLKAICLVHWHKEDTIKPIASYLAANLQEASNGASSPYSIVSHYEARASPREMAEQVLSMLVHDILSQHHYFTQFAQSLPLSRIVLLFLGEHPTPQLASLILALINISISVSPSFVRKFELVNGWTILKTVLPQIWDPVVNKAAFDLLLGRSLLVHPLDATTPTPHSASAKAKEKKDQQGVVSCTSIFPTIMSALQTGLELVASRCHIEESEEGTISWSNEQTMELLIEEFIALHSTSSTFRQVFESQQTTQLFIDTYKATVTKLAAAASLNRWSTRIVEKMTHLGLALALDNAVAGNQKREILDTVEMAESILNPNAESLGLSFDPSLVADNRTIRQRLASSRFSIQVAGERTVLKTMARTAEWRKSVQTSERKRLRKTVLDLKEHRRQISRLQEWSNLLTSERGLWPDRIDRSWRLDETEGPHRTRKKLEPENDLRSSTRVDTLDEIIRDVQDCDTDAGSTTQLEIPPWAESYEIGSTEPDEQQLADDIVDDKLRRIRHDLEPGDVIEAIATVARIDGVDSSPGLLILGRTHIYMVDGVVENDEGEIIEAEDAPKRLFFIPGSIVELDGPQRAQRWARAQVGSCSEKKFLFRDVALEIYFKDSRSLLIVFLDPKKRSDFAQRFSVILGMRPSMGLSLSSSTVGQRPLFSKSTSSMFSFKSDVLSTATKKWQAREMSNFAYLSILNQISGRTPSDATQYPVFPWVIGDYTSSTLDLNDPKSYRDLTKPMGALTPSRRQAAETRYSNLLSVEEEPFHYGTHFSSSMIVCHFMIRLAPFTNMFKTLQGGDWDLPDRLFSDMSRAYESAAHDLRGDVRELIPEFFTTPEFLENSANHDFGILQQTGERIHDVKLPPWAREDPLLFILMNRRALESPIVSEQLPAWIDLIWGCKQRDPASLNVFHPLSYEGSINLDDIKDDLEREASVGIIHNFGQTPRKLFQTPHPERSTQGCPTLPVGTLRGIEEDAHSLVQNSRCFKDLGPGAPITDFIADASADRLLPCPEGILHLPGYPQEFIEWTKGSSELRVIVDQRVVQVIENTFCSCAAFADNESLATGSSDYTVRLWKVSRGPHPGNVVQGMRVATSHIMRVHTDEVQCVAASRAWSLVVSGSKDGSAAFWDLNRGVYVRSVWHGEGDDVSAINLVAINESTGYVATCSKIKLCLHTINGRAIASLDLTKTASFSSIVPTITSLAFHEREYSRLGVLATGGPDASITLRTWTADGTPEGQKAQWEFMTIHTLKAKIGHGSTRPPAITALKFLGETLVHGEETGKAFIWTLPNV